MRVIHLIAARLDSHHRLVLAIVCALELVLGIGYSLTLGNEVRYWDEREYLELADALVTRGELRFQDDRAFRPPGYAFFLAGLKVCGLPLVAIRIVQFGLLAATTVLLARIIRRTHGNLAGSLTALWVLAYPALMYTAATFYPQTLGAFLLIAFLSVLIATGTSTLRAGAAGMLFGILVLTIPSFLPLIVLPAGWLVWRGRHAGFIPALVLALAAGATIGAWTARNYACLHEFVLVSTNSGLNLLLGNSEHATASSGVSVDIDRYHRGAEGLLGEVERDRYFRRMAVEWIKANPTAAAGLYVKKVLNFFALNDQLATAAEGQNWKMLILGITYAPLLVGLGVWLLLMFVRRPQPLEYFFVAFYLANALALAIFFTRIRFRLPVDYLAIGIGAIVLARLLAPRDAKSELGSPNSAGAF
ncbi:MAG: hypothetical protein ACKVX7_08080 [Planctomycetota bacterium]